MKSPKDFETFLNSIPKPEKGQRQLQKKEIEWAIKLVLEIQIMQSSDKDFLLMVLRRARAESIRFPEGLRESIKKAVLAVIDECERPIAGTDGDYLDDLKTRRANVQRYRALCAPDSPPSETNREEVKG